MFICKQATNAIDITSMLLVLNSLLGYRPQGSPIFICPITTPLYMGSNDSPIFICRDASQEVQATSSSVLHECATHMQHHCFSHCTRDIVFAHVVCYDLGSRVPSPNSVASTNVIQRPLAHSFISLTL